MSLDKLFSLAKTDTTNTVQLQTDASCEMACVVFNDTVVFEGNYWDFHPGCYGNEAEFIRVTGWRGNGVHSLMLAISLFAERMGFPLNVLSNASYKYEY